jgi:hypothetical protein
VSAGELALNAAVLFIVLFRNLGTHPVSLRRFTVPVTIVLVVGLIFLRNVPTVGNDLRFEALGLTVGTAFGVLAGLLFRMERTDAGQLITHAGAAFAALWTVVIVGRVAFSEGATHVYSKQVSSWSISNRITGSGAFTAMFVIMAVAMVGAMTITLGARAGRACRHREVGHVGAALT